MIRHGVRPVTMVFAIGAMMACDSGNENATDSVAPEAAADSVAPDEAAVAVTTPELPDSLGRISVRTFNRTMQSPTQFFDSNYGSTHRRPCNPAAAGCDSANPYTTVEIRPDKGARGLNPKDLHKNGHVIAMLLNTGPAVDSMYNLPVGREVYWVIDSGRSRFVYVNDRRDSLIVASTFDYRECEDGDLHPTRPPRLKAAFQRCLNKGPGSNNGVGDPSWISCLSGCCVAETKMDGVRAYPAADSTSGSAPGQ